MSCPTLSKLNSHYTPEELKRLLSTGTGELAVAVSAIRCERSFEQFVREAWPVVEPGRPLVWGWHLTAKCSHAEAVYNHVVPEEIDPEAKTRVGISSIVVNEPPRCSKSLIFSVLLNAWIWTKWPGLRFLSFTYSDDLALRDGLKTRSLVTSAWYQARWPYKLSEDQRSKGRFNLLAWNADAGEWKPTGGFRVSSTVLGTATGEGGDIRVLDDPHNVKKALSDIERKQANTFLDLTLPTRVVDPKRYATIIVMQRLHQDDATGHTLDKDTDWDHLCLPMEYEAPREKRIGGEIVVEGGNRCRTKLGFIDPRSKEGELLHTERWDREAVDKLKSELRGELGEFGVTSQLQQRPTPIGGGMFKIENLIPVPTWPDITDLERITRYWDKAATEGSGCYTAGVLMALHKSTQRTIVLDVVRGQWGTDKRERMILETALMDRRRFKSETRFEICVEQEPGSGGKDSARMTVKGLAGFRARAIAANESKEVDWAPLAAQVSMGAVEMFIASWNREFVKELEDAPVSKYKDQLDAAGRCFRHIWLSPRAGVVA